MIRGRLAIYYGAKVLRAYIFQFLGENIGSAPGLQADLISCEWRFPNIESNLWQAA